MTHLENGDVSDLLYALTLKIKILPLEVSKKASDGTLENRDSRNILATHLSYY